MRGNTNHGVICAVVLEPLVMQRLRCIRRGSKEEELDRHLHAVPRCEIRSPPEEPSLFLLRSSPWQRNREDRERSPRNFPRPFQSRSRSALDLTYFFNPACLRILPTVPGAKS